MIGLPVAGLLLSVLAAPASTSTLPAEDVLLKAMRDELARSVEKLRIESLEKPYFIAYTVPEEAILRASASFGAAVGSSESLSRNVTVEVRVGDPKTDNTGYLAMPTPGSGLVRSTSGVVTLPLDDSYQEIRRQLWLATDVAYKKALEDLSKKRAYLQTKSRSDDSPDFSEAEKASVVDTPPAAPFRLSDIEVLAKDLSAVFRETPDVTTSRVNVSVRRVVTRYVNSEGSSFLRATPRVVVVVSAATQAEDGTPLEDLVIASGRSLSDLPPAADLRRAAKELGQRLGQLRRAPHLETYNGPVLFAGQAAAELVAQALAPKLLATRMPIADDRMSSFFSFSENPFLDRIGGRVLPEGLDVIDDPTRTEQGGVPLLGGYKVDDDGVPARETRLIENGTLKTLLSTRQPVRGVERSTGNRRGAGPLPSNLLITASNGLGADELKAALLKHVQERGGKYGLIVRGLGNPVSALRPFGGTTSFWPAPRDRDANRLEPVTFAVKVFPDGTEEAVRVAEIVGLSAESFRDIAAASKEQTVYTAFFGSRSPTLFNFVPPELVSYAVPSLLFKDVNLRRPSAEIPRPPVVGHPYFAR